jgi:hypothetical protein
MPSGQEMVEHQPLDAEPIIAAFNQHGVAYVLIGAFAARAHNAPIPPTLDIDFTPATDLENLSRIAAALRTLDAQLRTADEATGVPFVPDPALIAQMKMLNLTCAHGDFDLAFFPSGTGGFADLDERATTVLVGATEARIADLGDIIRSKQAAGRSKDRATLPALESYAARQGIVIEESVFQPEPEPGRASGPPPRPTSAEDARRRLRELQEG